MVLAYTIAYLIYGHGNQGDRVKSVLCISHNQAGFTSAIDVTIDNPLKTSDPSAVRSGEGGR